MIESIKKMLEPKTVGSLIKLLKQYPKDALVSFLVPNNSNNDLNNGIWMASYRGDPKANEFYVEGKIKAIEVPLMWDKDEGPFDIIKY